MRQIDPQPGWGNYAIRGIEESFLPDSVSLFPETAGWFGLLGFLILLVGIKGFKIWQHWKRNYYRRWALKQIDGMRRGFVGEIDALTKLPALLKITAINAYGRNAAASLSGNRWLEFLDASLPATPSNHSFQGTPGKLLLELSYLPKSKWQADSSLAIELLDLANKWVRDHNERAADD